MFNLRVIELKSHSYLTKRLSQTHDASYKVPFYEYAGNAHKCIFLNIFRHIKFKFKFKLSFIVIPLHVGTYSRTKCRASQTI